MLSLFKRIEIGLKYLGLLINFEGAKNEQIFLPMRFFVFCRMTTSVMPCHGDTNHRLENNRIRAIRAIKLIIYGRLRPPNMASSFSLRF